MYTRKNDKVVSVENFIVKNMKKTMKEATVVQKKKITPVPVIQTMSDREKELVKRERELAKKEKMILAYKPPQRQMDDSDSESDDY